MKIGSIKQPPDNCQWNADILRMPTAVMWHKAILGIIETSKGSKQ